MTERVICVTDLGPGDGGKGGVVHYLANAHHAHTVIKRGGAQGSHGVLTEEDESFNFSQWGCATLEGIRTFCSEQMILMPIGLLNESEALRHQFGLNDPFLLLEADPDCICATPYHKILSRVLELLRKDDPRGTIGTGVGQAYRFHQKTPEISIKTKDLTDKNILFFKLMEQREKVISTLEPLVFEEEAVLKEDAELLAECLDLLYDADYPEYLVEKFYVVGTKLKLNSLSEVLKRDGTAIVECSHGVLTDAETGFKPHVSAIRTLPYFTEEMFKNAGFTGEYLNFGVRRAYEIRHGAGPIPTAIHDANDWYLGPGSHKMANRWQGDVRTGPFDLELFEHALKACNYGLDGICLTWFEVILKIGVWTLCEDANGGLLKMLARGMDDKVQFNSDWSASEHYRIEVFFRVKEILEEFCQIPLKMLSFGPKDSDKVYFP